MVSEGQDSTSVWMAHAGRGTMWMMRLYRRLEHIKIRHDLH